MKCKQNRVWTLKCFRESSFWMRVCNVFLSVYSVVLFNLKTFTPLYSGVKETLENSHHACIEESFETCWSPKIFCLIWLLSNEGSISNPCLVWGNISAGRAVILVLLQSTTKVVEKVVVQFLHLSFFNALVRISILSFQISSGLYSVCMYICYFQLENLHSFI